MPRLAELLHPLAGISEPGTRVVLVLLGIIVLIVAASVALGLALLIWRWLGRLRPALGTVDQAPNIWRGISAVVVVAFTVLAAVAGVLVLWNRIAPKPEPASAVVAAPAPVQPQVAAQGAALPPPPKAENRPGEMPSFASGESYAAVREKLIARGWEPVHAPEAMICPEGDGRCKDRPEALSCSSSGLAACEFVWQQGGNLLRIYTTGEEPVYKGSAMMITQASRPASAESPSNQ